MKINCLLAVAAFVAATSVLPALAQTRPPAQTKPAVPPAQPQTSPQPQGTGVVPESKIALIDSSAFPDPKTGIARFSALMNTLNREFQPRQTELNQLQQKIQASEAEIGKLQSPGSAVPVDPKSLQAKVESLEELKKEYQRKGEDGRAAFQRRQSEVFAPLENDILKALEAFAKQRGITVIIDANRVPLVYAAESIDITRAFIADFNTKNPVTASVTPPR